ncbi:MAG: DUF1565 domain-containing protein [Myxococcota bacterium]
MPELLYWLVSPIFDVVPIFGLISLLITSSSASAATFYVAKNGNDNNSGTLAQPFLTIAQGIAALGSGDTLLIRTGVYNESIITGWPVYQNLASGTSWTNATTIAAYQDEEVILRPYGGGGIIDFKSDEPSGFLQYVIIDRLILDGINAGSVGVNIQGGPHHIRLQNCGSKRYLQ